MPSEDAQTLRFPRQVACPEILSELELLEESRKVSVSLNGTRVVCDVHILKACSELLAGMLHHDTETLAPIKLPCDKGVVAIALYLRTGLIPQPFINPSNFIDIYKNADYLVATDLKDYMRQLFRQADNARQLSQNEDFGPEKVTLRLLTDLVPGRLPGALKHPVWRQVIHGWASHEPRETKEDKANWVRMLWSALDVIEETENTRYNGISGRKFVETAEKRWKEGRETFN